MAPGFPQKKKMPETVPTISDLDLVLRVVAATVLGGLIGFEREFSDQPAGFRTHILVCLGAALFTLAGAFGVDVFFTRGTADIQFDPTRVAAQVVTGIGFLGAGAILRLGLNVQGLTTAAALWVTAAIGVAVGLGYWVGAVATTAATTTSRPSPLSVVEAPVCDLAPIEQVIPAGGTYTQAQAGARFGTPFRGRAKPFEYESVIGIRLDTETSPAVVAIDAPHKIASCRVYWADARDDPWKARNAIPIEAAAEGLV